MQGGRAGAIIRGSWRSAERLLSPLVVARDWECVRAGERTVLDSLRSASVRGNRDALELMQGSASEGKARPVALPAKENLGPALSSPDARRLELQKALLDAATLRRVWEQEARELRQRRVDLLLPRRRCAEQAAAADVAVTEVRLAELEGLSAEAERLAGDLETALVAPPAAVHDARDAGLRARLTWLLGKQGLSRPGLGAAPQLVREAGGETARPASPKGAVQLVGAVGPFAQLPQAASHGSRPALEAQVEALKLAVAELQRQNARLRRTAVAAEAERAEAARRAALDQLARLGLPAGDHGSAGAAQAPPLSDEVAEAAGAYLQQQRHSYEAALARLRERHEAEVAELRGELAAAHGQLAAAEARHQEEAARLVADLRDPSRQAEARLLREDCAYLRERLEALAPEYEARVAAAGVSARISAERAWQAERAALQGQLAEAQRAATQAAAAARDDAAAALAAQAAQHEQELAARQREHERWLADVREECAAALAEREGQHASLLEELRAVRSAMSTRASTPQEPRWEGPAPPPQAQEQARTAGSGPWTGFAAGVSAAADAMPRWGPGRQAPAHGELVEPFEEEELPRRWQGQTQQAQREWQPRPAPKELQPAQGRGGAAALPPPSTLPPPTRWGVGDRS
eukprot:scaffold7.g3375.t1